MKIIIKTLVALMLLVDASLLLVVAAPRSAEPLFRVFRVYRLWSTKYEQCSLGDVISNEKAGMDAVPPDIQSAIHVITQEGDLDLSSTPLGNFWIHRKDARSLATMVAEQSRGVYEIGGHGVQAGDVVLDCGANIGVYTKHALDLGARLVVAIEPAPETLPLLRRNLAAQIEAGKVIVVPKGVWFQDGELNFYVEDAAWSDSFVRPGHGKHVTAPLTTIDHLVRDLNLVRVDFIKMDIEGAERQALTGAVDTVNHFHPRMTVALEHLDRDAEEIPEVIHRLWPHMHTQCGPCDMQVPGGKLRIQPQAVTAY